MEIMVGTSGWSNPIWNPDGLSWYETNAKLNAIELTMSSHQLPTTDQIRKWKKESKNLRWSVMVNRAITHFFRFNETAYSRFNEFRKIFSPLDGKISHYLFQLPPNAHPSIRDEIEAFFKKTKLGSRFALEWRNPHWFTKENVEWAKSLGICIVSADSPNVPRDIMCTSDTCYLRFHGRSDWFEYHYSKKELKNICQKIVNTDAKRVYAFFNNESGQLRNARVFHSLLTDMVNE